MKDNYGREINYLRISVTDRCNLRCKYCMPPEGVEKKAHGAILPLEEMAEIVRECASLGIDKVRITGGEPLVRKGIVDLCAEISAIPGIKDLAMTTNGILLPAMAKDLKAAGLKRLNISLDTLDEEKYHSITRLGSLSDALNAIRSATENGFSPIKLNTVLIGGFNDDEIPALAALTRDEAIDLRFIELMPIGQPVFPPETYVSCEKVLEVLPELELVGGDGTAALYKLPGAKGRVGLIRPLSRRFCSSCNRIRLTADGHLKPCLHSEEEISIVGLHGEALRNKIEEAIGHKPLRHETLDAEHRSERKRNMNQIGG